MPTRTRSLSTPRSGMSGAAASGVAAGSLGVGAAIMLDGAQGALSATAAVVVVLAYFVTGQLAERAALRLADASGMVLLMSSYVVRVSVLGAGLWWALATPQVAGGLVPLWLAVGAVASVTGWLTGLLLGHSRARIPVYDRPYEAPGGWDD